MRKILIIEDDAALRGELVTLLSRNGYEVAAPQHFDHVCAMILDSHADLVLLDIVLPNEDGSRILMELRRQSDVPVIMVTSKNTEIDEVLCMSFGADDFIAKPYNPSLLLLHIEAIFKRLHPTEQKIAYGELLVDTNKGMMQVKERALELSKNELQILSYLLKHQGQIVSRDQLINALWEQEEFIDDNTLNVNISRVRKKLEELGLNEVIHTKRGQGYIIL